MSEPSTVKRHGWILLATILTACTPWGDDGGDLRARLLATLDHLRVVEPRLDGSDVHASCDPVRYDDDIIDRVSCGRLPEPGSGDFRRLADLATEIRGALADSSAGALQAAGLVGILWHQGNASSVEKAVEQLARARRMAPDDPVLLNDLAAAHLVAAEVRQDPDDLIRALDLVERAADFGPPTPALRFNRALAMEKLYLVAQARDAWQEYAELEEEPDAWIREAEARARELARLAVDPGEAWLSRARDAISRRNRATVEALVRESPQEARKMVLGRLLGAWAEAEMEGDRDAAAEALWGGRALASALDRYTGERSPLEAVDGIDEAGDRRPELAVALEAWHRGQLMFSATADFDGAERVLADAAERLEATNHHMALWARYQKAGVDLFNGRFQEAEGAYARILEEADGSRHLALTGQTLWAMGVAATRQGRHQEAFAHYRSGQAFFQAAREDELAGALRYLVGEVLGYLSRLDEAARWKLGAAEALRRYPASVWAHNNFLDLGRLGERYGSPWAALAFRREAVRIAEVIGHPQPLAESNLWRSRSLSRLGKVDEARTVLRESRSYVAEMPTGINQERLRADLRFTEALLVGSGRPDEAIPALSAAIQYFEEAGPTHFLPTLRMTEARARLAAGDTAGAEARLSSAIRYLEGSGSTMDSRTLRAGLVTSSGEVFDEMISLMLARNRPLEALEYLERSRRVLWQRAPGSAEPGSIVPPGIDPGSALIEYAVLPDRIVAWLVGAEGLVTRTVTRSPEFLKSRAARFISLLQAPDPEPTELARLGRSLHEELVGGLKDQLEGVTRLVLVPDRFLHTVPFAALVDPATDRPLVLDYEIVLAPSAAGHLGPSGGGRRGEAPTSALLLGSPSFDRRLFPALSELSGASAEVLEISTLYSRASTVAGEAATATVLRSQLGEHEILHFAGHSVFNPERPEESLLLLSPDPETPDGTLTAAEIAAMNAPDLRLVVLSACSTLGAEEGRIGGLLGLSGSFIQAGADGVVASLWNVDDATSATLMTRFHREYRRHGDPARALRTAQAAAIEAEGGSLRHAKRWAPFVYTGS